MRPSQLRICISLSITYVVLTQMSSFVRDANAGACDEQQATPLSRLELEQNLGIIENDDIDLKERIDALKMIGSHGKLASSALPRLLQMLPGEGDELTGALLETVGKIGSPKALPKLRWMLKASPVRLHGKIFVELLGAIKACQAENACRLHE